MERRELTRFSLDSKAKKNENENHYNVIIINTSQKSE